jgi:hypothetical protein
VCEGLRCDTKQELISRAVGGGGGGGAQVGEDRSREWESRAQAEGPDLRRSKLKQIKILGPGRLREMCDTNLMAK